MQTILNIIVTILKSDFVTILIKIIIILITTHFINTILSKIYYKSNLEEKTHTKFLKSVINAIVWILGSISIMYQIPGMKTLASTLLASSGVVAAILGLAAKEAFGNIISGTILASTKPFDIGDRVILHTSKENIIGFVEDITLRHTVFRTYMNTEFIITNSNLDKYDIENTTRNSNGKGLITFVDMEISYKSDIDIAMKLMQDIIGSHELYFDIRTEEEKEANIVKVPVRIKSFEASGILLRASVRTKGIDESYIITSDCLRNIKKAFELNNITIPYTTYTINVENSTIKENNKHE